LSAGVASAAVPARPPRSFAAAPAAFQAIVVVVFFIVIVVVADPPSNAIAIAVAIADAIAIAAHRGLFALFAVFFWRASPSLQHA
jgi:hypothetical protein